MQNITTELIPAMRQSLEEALVDSAYMMAETVKDEVVNNKLDNGQFARNINAELIVLNVFKVEVGNDITEEKYGHLKKDSWFKA